MCLNPVTNAETVVSNYVTSTRSNHPVSHHSPSHPPIYPSILKCLSDQHVRLGTLWKGCQFTTGLTDKQKRMCGKKLELKHSAHRPLSVYGK